LVDLGSQLNVNVSRAPKANALVDIVVSHLIQDARQRMTWKSAREIQKGNKVALEVANLWHFVFIFQWLK